MPTSRYGKFDVDVGKLATMTVVLGFLMILTLTEHINDDVLVPFLTLMVGYTFGNGALAVRGKQSQPMLRPKQQELAEEEEGE